MIDGSPAVQVRRRWARPAATNSGGVKQVGTTVSGVNDLVTGRLAGSAAGDHDVDGGPTTITSPAISLSGGTNYTLSFSYYLAHGTNSSSADYPRQGQGGDDVDRLRGAGRGEQRQRRLGVGDRQPQRVR